MGHPGTVSVCIPTYNGATFVADAIQSILLQSWENFELLVVDDGSNDATVAIARSFSDSRIRISQNEKHLGIPGNWNRCLSLATGELVCLFHQDDVMFPGNLERKVQLLAADATISFVHSAAELLLEDSAPTTITNWIEHADHDFIEEGVAYFRKLFFHGNIICAPAVMARRQWLLNLGGFDEELGYAPDYEMWMKASMEGRVGFLCQPLIWYRWHDKNTSHAYRFARGVDEMFLARCRAVHYYEERTGERKEAEIFRAAAAALAETKRYAARLEQYTEDQKSYIHQLEQTREQLWAEVQRAGQTWEEQRSYIEHLEQERNQLKAMYARTLPQRLRRLLRKVGL